MGLERTGAQPGGAQAGGGGAGLGFSLGRQGLSSLGLPGSIYSPLLPFLLSGLELSTHSHR